MYGFTYAYCQNALRQKLEILFNNRIFVALSSARVLIPSEPEEKNLKKFLELEVVLRKFQRNLNYKLPSIEFGINF